MGHLFLNKNLLYRYLSSERKAEMINHDTIAAVATGTTNAGISIIRISGTDAISIADKVFV